MPRTCHRPHRVLIVSWRSREFAGRTSREAATLIFDGLIPFSGTRQAHVKPARNTARDVIHAGNCRKHVRATFLPTRHKFDGSFPSGVKTSPLLTGSLSSFHSFHPVGAYQRGGPLAQEHGSLFAGPGRVSTASTFGVFAQDRCHPPRRSEPGGEPSARTSSGPSLPGWLPRCFQGAAGAIQCACRAPGRTRT